MAHNVETMFSVREVPWHGLGNVISEAPDSKKAITMAGLDWDVLQQEVFIGEGLTKAEKYLANVRSDNGRVLGITSKSYRVVQNRVAFAFTDELLGEGVTYETAGSLKNGEKIWLLAKAPPHKVLGDTIDPYLCFTNTHTGKESVKVLLTPIRVVCNNTLNLALNNAQRYWTTRHTGDIMDKVSMAQLTLNLTNKYMDIFNEEAERLVQKSISDTKVNRLIGELLPLPTRTESNSRAINAMLNLRSELLYRYQKAPDLKKFKGTAWGFIAAVSDFTSHTGPRRKHKNYRENSFERIINGHDILDKAYRLAA